MKLNQTWHRYCNTCSMENFIKILMCLMLINFSCYAQENDESSFYQISNLYHERAQKFTCEFIDSRIDEIKNKRVEEIKSELETQAKLLNEAANVSDTIESKEQLDGISFKLSEISKSPQSKKILIHGLEKICSGSRLILQTVTRGAGITNSALIHTASMPITNIVSLFSGIFNREKKELGQSSDFIYRAIGPHKSTGSYSIGVVSSFLPNLFLKFNPALGIINLSVSLEMITNYQCYKVNPSDNDKVEFCQMYQDLRSFFRKTQGKSFVLGKKIQKLIDQGIVRRRSKRDPLTFCKLSKKKQVKQAKNALVRADFFKNVQGVLGSELILPIHKNSCTKILIKADAVQLNLLKNYQTHLEGIEIIYLKKNEYPSEFYYTSEELSVMGLESQLCHDVERDALASVTQNKIALMDDFLKAAMAPSMLATPETKKVIISDSDIIKGDINQLRNIIFSISPKKEDEDHIHDLEIERDRIVAKIKDTYKGIMKNKTFDSCIKFVSTKNIDLESLKVDFKRLSEINSSPLLKQKLERNVIVNSFSKAKKRLKLNWELVPTNNLTAIMDALVSNNVGNIIVLSHGKSSGHLTDVLGQELPKEAFSRMSPSLMSLNFYSCYSKKLIDLYGLEKKINAQKSFYKIRYLTNVKENDFREGNQFAPIAAFGSYLFELDHYLQRSFKGAMALQDNFSSELSSLVEERKCQADIQDLRIKKGSYAITLNENVIGTIDESNRHDLLEFPCNYLKDGDNTLKIKNIINVGGSEIENLDNFQIEIDDLVIESKSASLRKNSITIFNFSYERNEK